MLPPDRSIRARGLCLLPGSKKKNRRQNEIIMPANNFEDDVRKKMEELRFVPSGDVWDKVEEKIRADRKRRRLIFWLPLTGILAGGLIWFAWPQQNGPQHGQQQGQHQTQNLDSMRSVTPPTAPT